MVAAATTDEEITIRRAPDTTPQAGKLKVHLPDLRGNSSLLATISTVLGPVSAQAETYCSNADLGKILEDLTSDYAALLPQLHELLRDQETRMDE